MAKNKRVTQKAIKASMDNRKDNTDTMATDTLDTTNKEDTEISKDTDDTSNTDTKVTDTLDTTNKEDTGGSDTSNTDTMPTDENKDDDNIDRNAKIKRNLTISVLNDTKLERLATHTGLAKSKIVDILLSKFLKLNAKDEFDIYDVDMNIK